MYLGGGGVNKTSIFHTISTQSPFKKYIFALYTYKKIFKEVFAEIRIMHFHYAMPVNI